MDNNFIWIIAGTSTVIALSVFHYYTYYTEGKCTNVKRKNNNIIQEV